MTRQHTRRVSPKRQRGIATILLIVLVGLALVVTVVGVFRAASSAQERTLAVHAQTPAQATAFNAAETVRRYLDVVHRETVLAWLATPPTAGSPMALTLTDDATGEVVSNVEVEITGVAKLVPSDATDKNYRITARINGSAGTGAVTANSPVEVVYNMILPEPVGTPAGEPGPLNFFRDVNITGDINFHGSEHANINVVGDVTITNVSLSGVENINTTGEVTINSAVGVKNIHANGKVTLTQNTTTESVLSKENITVKGNGNQTNGVNGTQHGLLRSNKDIIFETSSADHVEAGGQLIAGVPPGYPCSGKDNTYIRLAKVEKEVLWYSCGGGVRELYGNKTLRYHGADRPGDYRGEQSLRVRESIDLRSRENIGEFVSRIDITHDFGAASNLQIRRYCAQRDLIIPHKNWADKNQSPSFARDDVVVGRYGRTLRYTAVTPTDRSWDAVLTDVTQGTAPCDYSDAAMPLVDIENVTDYALDPPRVDANALKGVANLVFERNADGTPKITVRSMNGVQDGVYTLGFVVHPNDANAKIPDHLCKPQDMTSDTGGDGGQNKCSDPVARICQNIDDVNESCFDYTPGDPNTTPPTLPLWTLGADNAQTMARGVVWFSGSLNVTKRGYVNAFIATGNISVTADNHIMAPNYAGYDLLCDNADIPPATGSDAIESPALEDLYPTNLCNKTAGQEGLVYNKIGNVSLVAGSFAPDNTFSGGNIAFSGAARVDGSVMAGNEVATSGATTISGYVTGAAQGVDTGASGRLGNTLNLHFDPVGEFKPDETPSMDPTNQAQLLWARYR